ERGNHFARTQCRESFNPEIHTHGGFGGRKLRPFFLNCESDVISPGCILGYRNAARFGFYHSGPSDIQPSNLCNGEIVVLLVPYKTADCKFCTLFRSMLALEGWILSAFRYKVSVSHIQVTERLLKRHTRWFFQPSGILLLLPL